MIFGHPISEVRKTAVAFIVAAVALAGYFVAFDPGFQDAAIMCTVAVLNVVAVYQTKNATPDDLSKAAQAAVASALALVGLFVTVNPGDVETIVGIVAALFNVAAVFWTRNEPATS